MGWGDLTGPLQFVTEAIYMLQIQSGGGGVPLFYLLLENIFLPT